MDPEIAKQIAAEVSKQLQGKELATEIAKQVSASQLHLIFLYAVILALVIALPTIIDICFAYYSRNKSWRLLLQEAGKNQLDKEELQALIKSTAEGPPGISGMSRSLMAFSVIIILGIAVFHLLACQGANSEIVKNVLSMLAATLASITGFYFGGKSAVQPAPAPKPATTEDQEKEAARRKAAEAKRKAAEEEAKRKAEEEAKRLEGEGANR